MVEKLNNENVANLIKVSDPVFEFTGRKSGMTQVYDSEGNSIAVTVIDLEPNVVTQVKTIENDGYLAVQVGIAPKAARQMNKAQKGHFKASGYPGFAKVKETRLSQALSVSAGNVLFPDYLTPGSLVDVSGVSKGKGFQGGMKRYNMAGGFKTHGASLSHRSLGSIGNRADPAKCFKNKKMPGQMGNELVTTQRLRVVAVDEGSSYLLVGGSVPGPKGSLVTIKKSVKGV